MSQKIPTNFHRKLSNFQVSDTGGALYRHLCSALNNDDCKIEFNRVQRNRRFFQVNLIKISPVSVLFVFLPLRWGRLMCFALIRLNSPFNRILCSTLLICARRSAFILHHGSGLALLQQQHRWWMPERRGGLRERQVEIYLSSLGNQSWSHYLI